MEHKGACHCGAITVSLRTEKSSAELGARACQCSFCRLHGASWTSDPTGTLAIDAAGPIGRYRLGTRSAEYLICETCGVVPAVTWQDEDRLLGVARVECLEIGDALIAHRVQTDFAQEAPEDRFARRARNWTPARLTIEP